jgi:hypothetical protein
MAVAGSPPQRALDLLVPPELEVAAAHLVLEPRDPLMQRLGAQERQGVGEPVVLEGEVDALAAGGDHGEPGAEREAASRRLEHHAPAGRRCGGAESGLDIGARLIGDGRSGEPAVDPGRHGRDRRSVRHHRPTAQRERTRLRRGGGFEAAGGLVREG